MSNFTDFIGGAGGGTADGYPSNPSGDGFDYTTSARMIPIAGTTDTLRVPSDVSDNGNTSLGYRRMDYQGSGGASEWLVSWSTLATFAGLDATTLSANTWSSSVIRNGKAYLGVYISNSIVTNGSYVVRVDLTTGVIEAFTRVDDSNNTVMTLTQAYSIFKSTDISLQVVWDITDEGYLRYVCPQTNSARTVEGIAVVVMDTDYSTIISQDIYFDNDQSYSFTPHQVTYFTQDLSLVVGCNANGTVAWLGSPGLGSIAISMTNDNGGLQMRTGAFLNNFMDFNEVDTVATHMNGASVAFKRQYGNGSDTNASVKTSRMQAPRSDVDTYLKELFKVYTGVQL